MKKSMKPRWITDEGELVRGVNVRRGTTAGRHVWCPAGIPATLRNDSWEPLQRVELTGTGRCAIFMRSGHMLGAIACAASTDDMGMLQGDVAEIGVVTGDTLRFDVVEAGTVRVLMRHSRTIYLTYTITGGNVTWRLHGPMPDMPPLWIVAADETTLSESFGATTLSGSGRTAGSLPAGDEKNVSDRVLNAYTRLKEKAAAMGLFIQPTLARYRLLDAAGDTIAVSPVVMTGATGMFQCQADIRLTSSDSLATLEGGAVTARAYRLRIEGFTSMPQPWRHMARSLVIETVPQLDPVDTKGLCSTSISSNGHTTTVAVRLAGLTGSSDAINVRLRNLTLRALATAPGNFLTQSSFTRPFEKIPAENRTGLHADAPLSAPQVPVDMPWRDDISFRACHETGGELFLANLRREGFRGYSPAMFATKKNNGDGTGARAAICVHSEQPDGKTATIVSTAEGEAANIAAFSPLLAIPDPTATSVSVTIARGDEIRTENYPLSPLPQLGIACYISPTLSPLVPRGEVRDITLPEPTPASERTHAERGYLAICTPAHIATPHAGGHCTAGGDIAVITDAPRSRATWDFARRKLLLFGSGGTHIVTIDAKGSMRSLAQIDNRPVISPHAVSAACGTHGKTLVAVAGGDLIEVSQSSVATIMRHCRGEFPGWCGRFGEIWLSGGDAPLRRITVNGHATETTEVVIGGSTPWRPLQWGAHLLLAGGGSLLDTSHETFPAQGVRILLATRHSPASQPSLVRLNLFSPSIAGTVTIKGDNGTRTGAPLLTLRINGALNAPFPLRLMAPQREWLEMHIDATAGDATECFPPQFGKMG